MRWQVVMMTLALSACAAHSPPPQAPTQRPGAGPAQAATQPPRGTTRRPTTPAVWRVLQEGTTGCADSQALRRLREPAVGADALRGLAAARAAGGCITVFPGQAWHVISRDGDLLRMAPVTLEGTPQASGSGPLYFWRDQVAEERGG